ncbi:MAG: esterase, partial [Pedosphaera sp.]|nr:esterase [Pedosphaera sp.]
MSKKNGPPFQLFPLLALCSILSCAHAGEPARLRFEVSLTNGLLSTPQTGRLLVVIGRKDTPEPRLTVSRTGPDAPFVLGSDAKNLSPGKAVFLDATAITFPITNLSELPPGDYFVQALLVSNRDLLSPQAPGNLYSAPQKVHLDPAHRATVKLALSAQIPPERLPDETELVKFVKIQSRLLSQFHSRPIYLRAGIILPKGFQNDPTRKYPLWVRIGGLDTRYSRVAGMMAESSNFRKTWMAEDTPRMILLHLDGAGPNGDAYQVNSANNGPYGDAITQELIPYIEKEFRAIGQPKTRVLSGVSTGGWASLALQVFYPDFFNGTWSSCPDGVDFRAFELVNIYDDENAYVNSYGFERPSERTLNGDVRLTMRREVQIENVLGHGNSWTTSG